MATSGLDGTVLDSTHAFLDGGHLCPKPCGGWYLAGEIDMADEEGFWRACTTAAGIAPVSRVHCRELRFVSAAGLALKCRLALVPAPHPMVFRGRF